MEAIMSKVRNFKNFIGCIGLVGALVAHVSIQCLGEEAWPTNHGSNRGTAYSLFVATHPSSALSLIGGRRYDFNNKRFYGWIQQISTSTGIGDAGFSAAGSTNRNINVSVSVPDPGSAYFDLSNSTKESMCTSAVWDTSYSNWWVLCRSFNTDNKYVIYLVKATTTGTITAYKTDLGGGTDNNYHAVPGRQDSLLYDSGTLVVVGHRGQNLTGADSVKYRPFIATFTVADAPQDPTLTNWASTVEDFSDTDGNAYNHKAIAVTKAGSNYFAIYTKINHSQGNLRIAKYTTGLAASTGDKLFTDIVFNSPYTSPIVAPTAIAHYTSNATTIYGVGAIKSSASGVWKGFVGAFSTTDGSWVTSCDSDGYVDFQVQSGTDTLTYDLAVSSDGYGSGVGAAHDLTNYKAYVARLDLRSSQCAFDTNFGTGGVYFHSEGVANTIYRAAAIDNSGQLINAGTQQVIDGETGVIRDGGYYRTFSSTSSTSALKYVTGCSMDPIPATGSEGDTFTVTGTFTYSDNSTSSIAIDQLTCSGLPGERSGSTLTAGAGTVSGSCYAIGNNSTKCGDFSVTFATTTTTTSTTTTTTTTMCEGSDC